MRIKKLLFTAVLVFQSSQAFGFTYEWSKENMTQEQLRNAFSVAMEEMQNSWDYSEKNQDQARSETQSKQNTLNVRVEGPSEIERYFDEILLNAENVVIEGNSGELHVDLTFPHSGHLIALSSRSDADYGSVYALRFLRTARFKLYYQQGHFIIDEFQGIELLAKLPIVSDLVRLRQLSFDVQRQIALFSVTVADNFVNLVATVNVRFRSLVGYQYDLPFLSDLPNALRNVRFRF